MSLINRIENKVWARQRRKLPTLVRDWPDKYRLKGCMRLYKKRMGYSFDFKHPTLFTEKLQNYKLFYDSPDFPDAVDKYLFKAYIERKLGKGYTIPLYGAWDTLDGLRSAWAELPNMFVLKSTLQSNGKCIKIIEEKKSIDFGELEKELNTWLDPKNTLIDSYCRAYYRAKPRILAEQYMAQLDGQLFDYKFFCFDGKPHCIYVATDSLADGWHHISFFDLQWKRMDVQYDECPHCEVEKPRHFDEMCKIAEKLSKDFPFVRVDYFDTEEKLYVAELTFYPGGGHRPYHPESFNRELGDLFILPKERKAT